MGKNSLSLFHRISRWVSPINVRYPLATVLKVLIFISAFIFGILTYWSFKNSGPLSTSSETLFFLLNIDVSILLILAVMVTQQVISYRRDIQGKEGAKLHGRIIRWFGALLILPSIITMLFSVSFINLVIESWFNDKVKNALYNSRLVAEAYLNEHKKLIVENAISVANEIQNQLSAVVIDKEEFSRHLNKQAEMRGIRAAIVFDKDRDIIGRTDLAFNLLYQPVTDEQLAASHTAPLLLENPEQKEYVRALIRISPRYDAYLLVSKFVDPKVLRHLKKTDMIVKDYDSLDHLRTSFKFQFILIFVMVAFLLMLLVVFLGTAFGNRLARPIAALIAASEAVKAGNLNVRVDIDKQKDELGTLGFTFNQMLEQLAQQKKELLSANQKINQRRYFIESVLRGVRAGVIGASVDGYITLINTSAVHLLQKDVEVALYAKLTDLIPEMAVLFEENNVKNPLEIQVSIQGEQRIFMVQITQVLSENEALESYVITFDDVTDLIQAQRKAAWADVGRRIAHEIKNPLTPILLSTERLKSRFLPQIQEGQAFFEKYLETITRQVRYLQDLISEFSEFARMPAPSFEPHNLSDICCHVVQLYHEAFPKIQFKMQNLPCDVVISIDMAQIERAIANLVKNAAEVLQQAKTPDPTIKISIHQRKGMVDLIVEDNGPGFPGENFENLLEPYVTFKEMGTGLGLAIVRRTMEDHGGKIILQNVEGGGASVCLRFLEKDSKMRL